MISVDVILLIKVDLIFIAKVCLFVCPVRNVPLYFPSSLVQGKAVSYVKC